MDHASAPWTAPGLAAFETMAAAALAAIPEPFRSAAAAIALRVEDFAPADMLDELQMQPFDLTGLYDGIPLTEKSTADQPTHPDTIWLFRRPILDEWAERGNEPLGHLIAHVLVHELAHHFGWSDDDIAAIDEWWT
ncbi:MAG: metallopeptidase family protein [Rhodobacteraceae bacterium]|nr:metallopeptidase family protein [Paracoccaceae bacterium]